MKHINELTRHTTNLELITPTSLLTPGNHVSGKLKEKRDKKLEAIEYLKNDDELDITLTEIDEGLTLIKIKMKQDGKTHLCADCKHMSFKGEKLDSKMFCKLKNELQEYIVDSCDDYVKGEYQ